MSCSFWFWFFLLRSKLSFILLTTIHVLLQYYLAYGLKRCRFFTKSLFFRFFCFILTFSHFILINRIWWQWIIIRLITFFFRCILITEKITFRFSVWNKLNFFIIFKFILGVTISNKNRSTDIFDAPFSFIWLNMLTFNTPFIDFFNYYVFIDV